MNIVMVGPFAFQPKATISVRAIFIAQALVERGHQVTILLPPYDNLADSGQTWEREGVRVENMTLRRNDTWHQLSVPLRMARRTTLLEPDVVHVFKPIGYGGLAGTYLRWFSGRPLVLDTDDWEGTGGWNDVNPYPALWKRLFDWQERWLARHADAVTVASRTLQAQVWGFGVDPGQVVFLPNGPDPNLRHLTPASDEEKAAVRASMGVGERPFLLYLGNIPRGTDLDLALEALVHLGEQLPEARLVIAGAGDGLPGLQSKAQHLGLEGRVIFPGWIEPEEVPLMLAAADAIVNPYRDTLINRAKCAVKVVMAMALGKAVVTSRLGENLTYIDDGRSGLLTAPGDAADLARGLQSVLSDRQWAAELGHNARKRIWSHFGWDVRVGEVERSYQIALERQGRQ